MKLSWATSTHTHLSMGRAAVNAAARLASEPHTRILSKACYNCNIPHALCSLTTGVGRHGMYVNTYIHIGKYAVIWNALNSSEQNHRKGFGIQLSLPWLIQWACLVQQYSLQCIGMMQVFLVCGDIVRRPANRGIPCTWGHPSDYIILCNNNTPVPVAHNTLQL